MADVTEAACPYRMRLQIAPPPRMCNEVTLRNDVTLCNGVTVCKDMTQETIQEAQWPALGRLDEHRSGTRGTARADAAAGERAAVGQSP